MEESVDRQRSDCGLSRATSDSGALHRDEVTIIRLIAYELVKVVVEQLKSSSLLPRYFLFVVVLLVVNTQLQWPYAIRFIYTPLNYWCVSALSIALPISMMVAGWGFTHPILKRVTVICGVLLLIPMFFYSLTAVVLGYISSPTGPQDLELQDSVEIGAVIYRVYLDQGGGAFSPPLTVLRKERDIIPGVKIVRTIWADAHYGNARIRAVSNSALEVAIDGNFFEKVVTID